jgi:hypothetical protein
MIKWKIVLLQNQNGKEQKIADELIEFKDWCKIKAFIKNLKEEKEMSYL